MLYEVITTNPVGISVKAQSFYSVIKDSLKEEFNCIVGPIMVNKIVVFLPSTEQQLEYDERSELIEKIRRMIRELTRRIDVQFKVGIGAVTTFDKLAESYKGAVMALNNSKSRVAHVKDLSIGCEYANDYPIDIEIALLDRVEKGDLEGTKLEAGLFYDWMILHYPDCMMDVKLKVLEMVLFAEQKAFLNGGMIYDFRYRKDYLMTSYNFV